MNIGFIVDRRYLRQEMPRAVLRVFAAWGVHADVIAPQGCRFEASAGIVRSEDGAEVNLNRYDVLVARNRCHLGLAMLAYAEDAGIPAINTHDSTQRVRNKARMAVALTHGGVPCAPTYLADDVAALAELPRRCFPLILKATYGDNSQGLRLIRHPEDLRDIHWGEDLVLAQCYLPNDGFDLKLYVCGSTVVGVRKPSPFNGDPRAPHRLVDLDAGQVDLARRCGAIFGLEIYGVDTIETPDGPAVIEVNEFPNFTGVPGAAELIADYILSRVGAQPRAVAA